MRVTNQTLMMSAQANLQSNKANLARLQQQAADLKKITRPSDDPTATASSLQVRGQQAAAAQYSRNIDNGRGWLNTADSALSSTTNILRRVKDLTIQGSNGVLTPAARESIATRNGRSQTGSPGPGKHHLHGPQRLRRELRCRRRFHGRHSPGLHRHRQHR